MYRTNPPVKRFLLKSIPHQYEFVSHTRSSMLVRVLFDPFERGILLR